MDELTTVRCPFCVRLLLLLLPLLLEFTMLLELKPGHTCDPVVYFSGVYFLTSVAINHSTTLTLTLTLTLTPFHNAERTRVLHGSHR